MIDTRRRLLPCLIPLWLVLSGVEASGTVVRTGEETPRSLVLMISDGFGPASLTLARTASPTPLHLDSRLVGSVATASSDSHITDSAASATALASGFNTANKVVGLDPAGGRLPNLMELARAAGLRTGVVTTTSVTHATPASFSAHIMSRDDELSIAVQQLDCELDVFLGGGSDFFKPVRPDGRDLLAEAREGGWVVVETAAQLANAESTPLLGVFTPGHFAFRIDVEADRAASPSSEVTQPTLAEMTARALDFLATDGAPFVLVVEGGRIDHAAHDNDVASHLAEILDYDEAVGVALEFAEADGRTLVVSVSDHETGGLVLGRNHGLVGAQDWDPSQLRLQTSSFERMIARMKAGEDVLDVFREVGGVADLDVTEAERMQSASALLPGLSLLATETRSKNGLRQALMAPLARRAGVEWGTWWHTAVDVPLFAAGIGRMRLIGHRTHAELGRRLIELLGLQGPAVEHTEDDAAR